MPDGVYERFADTVGRRGGELHAAWADLFAAYKAKYPEEGKALDAIISKNVPQAAFDAIPVFPADEKGMATRESASKVENALAPHYPWLIGGSADLDESTKTNQTARRPAPSSPRAAAAGTSISACANTPWAPSATASLCRACAPTARPS